MGKPAAPGSRAARTAQARVDRRNSVPAAIAVPNRPSIQTAYDRNRSAIVLDSPAEAKTQASNGLDACPRLIDAARFVGRQCAVLGLGLYETTARPGKTGGKRAINEPFEPRFEAITTQARAISRRVTSMPFTSPPRPHPMTRATYEQDSVVSNLDGKIALVSRRPVVGIRAAAIAKLLGQPRGPCDSVTSRKLENMPERGPGHHRRTAARPASHGLPYWRVGRSSSCCRNIRERFARLDILVNNAATNPQFCHVLDTDPGAFQKTLEVNVRGYFFMSVHAGKLMRDNGGGSIVNVASINGVSPVLPRHLLDE
ncbi:hypothetical protein FQR65_LT21014 [Abscondita terminalis]|nr:hypothetical protein FQR65_LT21014 [Abscondita terminalis]